MQLHFKVSNGSGYDVACGMTDSPITYQLNDGLAEVNQIQWKPPFSASLFFVYLNTKQQSSTEVDKYQDRKASIDLAEIVEEISVLSQTMITATSLDVFNKTIDKHEEIMSAVLGYPTVKELYFSDYKGAVKSLGAWGGDFILATGNAQDRVYFADKGFSVIHELESLIL
jgi:mevalonate kinase